MSWFKAVKVFIFNYKVPITAFEAVLEDIDVDDDGNVCVKEVLTYLGIFRV